MKIDPSRPDEYTIALRQLRNIVPPRGNYQSGAGRQPCPMLSPGRQTAHQPPTAGLFHPSQPYPRFVAPVCLPFTRSHPGSHPPGFAHPPAYRRALFQVSDRSPLPLHLVPARSGFSGPTTGVHQALHLPFLYAFPLCSKRWSSICLGFRSVCESERPRVRLQEFNQGVVINRHPLIRSI